MNRCALFFVVHLLVEVSADEKTNRCETDYSRASQKKNPAYIHCCKKDAEDGRRLDSVTLENGVKEKFDGCLCAWNYFQNTRLWIYYYKVYRMETEKKKTELKRLKKEKRKLKFVKKLHKRLAVVDVQLKKLSQQTDFTTRHILHIDILKALRFTYNETKFCFMHEDDQGHVCSPGVYAEWVSAWKTIETHMNTLDDRINKEFLDVDSKRDKAKELMQQHQGKVQDNLQCYKIEAGAEQMNSDFGKFMRVMRATLMNWTTTDQSVWQKSNWGTELSGSAISSDVTDYLKQGASMLPQLNAHAHAH